MSLENAADWTSIAALVVALLSLYVGIIAFRRSRPDVKIDAAIRVENDVRIVHIRLINRGALSAWVGNVSLRRSQPFAYETVVKDEIEVLPHTVEHLDVRFDTLPAEFQRPGYLLMVAANLGQGLRISRCKVLVRR